ncbi:short-chain dehydrogenase/reductase SDR [Rhizorhabdus wittichii RW1]|uniref:Short-chain dehydrogenase/reductase SDR n=1 Tax=Rhizorhabdus wittichii (strain DSM 6014 / CCUG 31198 / JCM 15750 / NBRC 105917 / EY 4224 / RW1) TaxID=392499 RepID=A0A9J9HAQ7_RHIWR|nr:short-chain dehydrogenase/reductase SDR [Rhizorhabdus wittichii RW1]
MSGDVGLAGKVAVLFGGTGGIGAATASALARAGARIALVGGRDLARAEAVAARLPGDGHRGYVADIASSEEIGALAARVAKDFGRADILVNGAGVTRAIPHADLDALDDALIDLLMVHNVRAPIAAVRAFREMLAASGDGLVVNISSIAATTAVGSNVAYCAAKAAMDTMGAALARALAPAIRVVSVSPGAVDTDFVPGRDRQASERIAASTPLRRLASPEEVADAVVACATHLRFTTGSVVQVDGGRHL